MVESRKLDKADWPMSGESMDTGLEAAQRAAVVRLLNRTLANESILLIRTKKCHWDIVGHQVLTLQRLFDEQHAEISTHVDGAAERIRMLGGYPASTAQEFVAFAKIKERPGPISNATDAVQTLLADHEMIARTLREFISQTSESFKDPGSAEFFTHLLRSHERAAWMLRSFLQEEPARSPGKIPVAA